MAQKDSGIQEGSMKKSERELIRLFYQSIPTAQDKAIFQAVMGRSKEERLAYIGEMLNRGVPITPELSAAILAATTLTKEDRVMIFSNIVRQWLFSLLGF
jgi:hypothetical protein